ncbi:hypothetical protein EUGRSUZ_K00097 [Eucalyptus grandis]|uniref:Uncharacterized protein n=2 Tax=Eucalyptus grandis TaxID=71139 RepID=A0ACC3IP98_EUCGR|nr:hypothetical protein EUGRSUZ_K00097 [Eucalyptus grandis]
MGCTFNLVTNDDGLLLKTIDKQSSNSTDTSYQTYDNPNRGQPTTDCFPSVHVVPSKLFLRCLTLRASV